MADTIKGKLKNGFAFEIEQENLDDYELLELFAEIDTNPLVTPRIFEMMLGEEQKNALLEHLRGDNGKVKISDMASAIGEIFSVASEKAKNL